MEKLHNCPNCGGYLNDGGRCEFCGSKVYDFVNVDFDKNSKTYIRVKYNGKIMYMPVIFSSYSLDVWKDNVDLSAYLGSKFYIPPVSQISGSLDFFVMGDSVMEVSDVK